MKKKTQYLDFYYKCIEAGEMPKNGLCRCLGKAAVNLFKPTPAEFGLLPGEKTGGYFWGFSGYICTIAAYNTQSEFTPLRQTIVLFLAAMNNEL